ncbi:8871_t:CDS:2 [Gigaspora rosea]|nr:8871_t:CDS:2 [Gigaspora rosea]
MWTNDQLSLLIAERRNRNADYHNIPGSSRGKFQNLVRDHTLMCQYMAENRAGRRTRTRARYFEKFRSHFWERPETQFDQIHNINASSRQREIRRRNCTPPPSYEEILSMMSCRESTTTQRDRSASPDRGVSSNRRVINTAPERRLEGSFFRNNASQNDSDISMPYIEGSQSPSCIENINEEN